MVGLPTAVRVSFFPPVHLLGVSLALHSLLESIANPTTLLFIAPKGAVDVPQLAQRLWGNIYYNEETRKFSRKPSDAEAKRSFVHFVLEPLYKLYTQVISADTDALKETLAKLQITLKPSVYKMDVRPLLKVVLGAFFGPSKGLIDMITRNVPSPVEAAQKKVRTDISPGRASVWQIDTSYPCLQR